MNLQEKIASITTTKDVRIAIIKTRRSETLETEKRDLILRLLGQRYFELLELTRETENNDGGDFTSEMQGAITEAVEPTAYEEFQIPLTEEEIKQTSEKSQMRLENFPYIPNRPRYFVPRFS